MSDTSCNNAAGGSAAAPYLDGSLPKPTAQQTSRRSSRGDRPLVVLLSLSHFNSGPRVSDHELLIGVSSSRRWGGRSTCRGATSSARAAARRPYGLPRVSNPILDTSVMIDGAPGVAATASGRSAVVVNRVLRELQTRRQGTAQACKGPACLDQVNALQDTRGSA